MVIGVNTTGLENESDWGYSLLTSEVLTLLTDQHPEHQFYFFREKPPKHGTAFGTKATTVVLDTSGAPLFFQKYWFGIKLRRALKKVKADVFLSPVETSSFAVNVPQCLLLPYIENLQKPNKGKKGLRWLYKKKSSKHIKKGAVIVAGSQFSKVKIAEQYKVAEEKIRVVHQSVLPPFNVLSATQKSAVKETYTEGKEYFLYTGALSSSPDVLTLFKAFSIFKKRQQSSWKLVLSGEEVGGKNSLGNLLKTYKYRGDVVVTGPLSFSEKAQVTASAYALLAPVFTLPQIQFVLGAFRCGVPCLVASHPFYKELCGSAALYLERLETAAVAENLMLVYKDEALHLALVRAGKERTAMFSLQQTADGIWGALLQAVAH